MTSNAENQLPRGKRSTESLGPREFGLTLMDDEADALLSLAEWALNRPDLDLGVGIRKDTAEIAARKVEAARNRDQEPWCRGARIVAVTYESPDYS